VFLCLVYCLNIVLLLSYSVSNKHLHTEPMTTQLITDSYAQALHNCKSCVLGNDNEIIYDLQFQ